METPCRGPESSISELHSDPGLDPLFFKNKPSWDLHERELSLERQSNLPKVTYTVVTHGET